MYGSLCTNIYIYMYSDIYIMKNKITQSWSNSESTFLPGGPAYKMRFAWQETEQRSATAVHGDFIFKRMGSKEPQKILLPFTVSMHARIFPLDPQSSCHATFFS